MHTHAKTDMSPNSEKIMFFPTFLSIYYISHCRQVLCDNIKLLLC